VLSISAYHFDDVIFGVDVCPNNPIDQAGVNSLLRLNENLYGIFFPESSMQINLIVEKFRA
jgi:hypothetical protein